MSRLSSIPFCPLVPPLLLVVLFSIEYPLSKDHYRFYYSQLVLYFVFRSGESETQVSSFECRQGAEKLLGIYFNVLRSLDYCLLLNLSVCRGVAVTNELRCQPFLFLLDGIITTLQ